MTVYKPIVIDGIKYASVADACRKHGFHDRGDASYIGRLLNGGMAFHEAAKLRRAYNADLVVPVRPHAPPPVCQPRDGLRKAYLYAADNGGWALTRPSLPNRPETLIGAYSNKEELIAALAKLI